MYTSFKTILGVAALAVLVALGTHHALAAKGGNSGKGGKNQTDPMTVTFGDAAGDAVRSDGLGAYSGELNVSDGSLEFSTGSRELYLDFSVLARSDSVDPFGSSATAGWVSDVSVSIPSVDGAAGTSSSYSATMLFTAPAPNGSGPTEWRLNVHWVTVTRNDTDGDGIVDSYSLVHVPPVAPAVSVELWWQDEPIKGNTGGHGRGSGPPYHDDGWRWSGWFTMPWTADVAAQ